MAATYNINGQQMTEEEFQKWQEENGFNFGFGRYRKQRRWDHKMHIYQCYKNTVPDNWLEISEEDIKRDVGKTPKFTKKLYYVQKNGQEYIIQESPVVAVFYDHMEDVFLYMKEGGIIEEKNCFSTFEKAMKAIREMEDKKSGTHTLYNIDGSIIKIYQPKKDEEIKKETPQ